MAQGQTFLRAGDLTHRKTVQDKHNFISSIWYKLRH